MIYPILVLATIVLPWLGALSVWLIDDRHPRAQHTAAVISSVLAAIAAFALIPLKSSQSFSLPSGFIFGDISFTADGLGVFLAAIAAGIGSLAVIFSIDYMRGEEQLGRYYTFMLFFIGSMTGLVLSANLFYTFIFWEMTALSSYALISFYNDDPKAVRGGLKALIITQLGGIGMLVGALVLYNQFHTFDIPTLMAQMNGMPANLLSIVAFGFLIASIAKSAQVPLHTWLPDAMEAPTTISALIHAATMVNAGVYLLARFYPAFESLAHWKMTVIIVGAFTALLAAVMAMVASDLKRVLAYSTISQLGYMVYAVGVGGFFASQFHLLSHAIFKALLFLAAGAVIHSVGTRDLRLMGGLGKKMPFVRNVFVLGALALAGIPFMNGFWSKESILEAGLVNGPIWAFLVMVLSAGLTAYYSIRVTWLVFFGEERSRLHSHRATAAIKIALAPLALGALTSWLLAGPFVRFLADSLPFHHLHLLTTGELIGEVWGTWGTYLTLTAIAGGVFSWSYIFRHQEITPSFHWLGDVAEHSFGFEKINQFFVNLTNWTAEGLRYSQTGVLSWNLFGIILGLLILLYFVQMGGL
ncbi:MAG: NADH-quinone oxidoreductase subunit L [Anaerolineaceae bacterium]|nr:NADH-quinone oxidoreductase subunit L [Anaerolineaceae bacterium]